MFWVLASKTFLALSKKIKLSARWMGGPKNSFRIANSKNFQSFFSLNLMRVKKVFHYPLE